MTEEKAVMRFFQCDRRTAMASMERGCYIVNYLQRTICPGDLDTDAAYKLVWFIYRRKYQDRLPWYVAPEDLVQEGVLRLLEMAGHPRFRDKGFQFYLALNAMKGFIERQRRMLGGIGGTIPGYEETLRQDAWSSWQTDWQAKREEDPGKTRTRPHSCTQSPEVLGKTVQQIYEVNEDIIQAGLGRRLGISPRSAGKKVAQIIPAGLAEKVDGAGGQMGQAIRLTAEGRVLIDVAA
jgi:hypothetical protein